MTRKLAQMHGYSRYRQGARRQLVPMPLTHCLVSRRLASPHRFQGSLRSPDSGSSYSLHNQTIMVGGRQFRERLIEDIKGPLCCCKGDVCLHTTHWQTYRSSWPLTPSPDLISAVEPLEATVVGTV
jgi:hypothetical protein